jgi:hypothetical protein
MKKLIFLTLLTFLSFESYSQSMLKYRSKFMCYKFYSETYSKWDNWSEWEESSLLITIDLDVARITVYSKQNHTFDILKFLGESIDSDGYKFLEFYCLDNEGIKCSIRIVNQTPDMVMYIDFDDMKIAYDIKMLD